MFVRSFLAALVAATAVAAAPVEERAVAVVINHCAIPTTTSTATKRDVVDIFPRAPTPPANFQIYDAVSKTYAVIHKTEIQFNSTTPAGRFSINATNGYLQLPGYGKNMYAGQQINGIHQFTPIVQPYPLSDITGGEVEPLECTIKKLADATCPITCKAPISYSSQDTKNSFRCEDASTGDNYDWQMFNKGSDTGCVAAELYAVTV